jgi:hypothetical protein
MWYRENNQTRHDYATEEIDGTFVDRVRSLPGGHIFGLNFCNELAYIHSAFSCEV